MAVNLSGADPDGSQISAVRDVKPQDSCMQTGTCTHLDVARGSLEGPDHILQVKTLVLVLLCIPSVVSLRTPDVVGVRFNLLLRPETEESGHCGAFR